MYKFFSNLPMSRARSVLGEVTIFIDYSSKSCEVKDPFKILYKGFNR